MSKEVKDSYERELCRGVLAGGPGAMGAAVALLERSQPATLIEATTLVASYGELTSDNVDLLTRAFDRYWHLRDMPCS